jgi:hypothetical protein
MSRQEGQSAISVSVYGGHINRSTPREGHSDVIAQNSAIKTLRSAIPRHSVSRRLALE